MRRLCHSFTPGLVSSLALAAMLVISCKDKPAENAVDAAASAAPPAASSVAPLASAAPAASASGGREEGEGKRGGQGGPAAMLFQAARTLDLKDEQKAKIDAAEKAAHAPAAGASPDAMRDAAKEIHAELVAGIKAGKIDTAKLEPKYSALDKLIAAGHDREADALTALHGALDATQRKAVVANVRAKQAAREAKQAAHAGPDGGGAGADAGRSQVIAKRVERLTHGLDLDAEQQKKLDAIAAKEDAATKAPDAAEMKKKVDVLLTAFEKDTFDGKKVDPFDAKKARAPMDQEAKLLGQIVPILKPEQREKLAARMDKGPSPHGGAGRRAPGHRPHSEPDEDD